MNMFPAALPSPTAMKRYLFFIGLVSLIMFPGVPSSARDQGSPSKELRIGDSLESVLLQFPHLHNDPLRGYSPWFEGLALIVHTKQPLEENGTLAGPFMLMAPGNPIFPYGVLQGKPPDAYFLFDMDGDGRLDTRTIEYILPFWVVLRTPVMPSSKDQTIVHILDFCYQAFQADRGPAEHDGILKANSSLETYQTNTMKPNRDLAYLIAYYMQMVQDPAQAMVAIKTLEEKFMQRFSFVHPVILLYQMESRINQGDYDKAAALLARLRKLDPNFIPAKFYEWYLLDPGEKQDALGRDLLRQYPNHWLIRKISE